MSFTKILCPIDFSPGSEQALRAATRLAREHRAQLIIAHAWYVPPTAYGMETGVPGLGFQAIADDAQRGLDDAARQATAWGAEAVSTVLLSGTPWAEICGTAGKLGADLLVIGTHGRTGVERILLGSVAEKVVRHAPCPVLAIRKDGAPEAFRNVLCPIDFSDSTPRVLDLAATLVKPGGTGITLLHIVELPIAYVGELAMLEFGRSLHRRSVTLLEEHAAKLRTRVDVPVTINSRIGRAGQHVLAVIEEDRRFDLVVMGGHGRTGIKRALLGSVAEKTVRHARCPVIVVHTRRD